MTRYRVPAAVSVETNHAMLGTVEAKFKKGDVTPKSEAEEVALQVLVLNGQARVLDDAPSAPRSRPKKAKAKAAPAPAEPAPAAPTTTETKTEE